MKDHWPETGLGAFEILVGLLIVANFESGNILVGAPILVAGIYTFWNRGRSFRNYRRVQAALGIILLSYAVVLVVWFLLLVNAWASAS